ncbi:MAG TPA: EFR1 family ferrodoxin [Candidatus Lachnoclostridium avicola]|nr:EFR1 family ferrodoxin [Candidatus Lachnoclostridium avicola]
MIYYFTGTGNSQAAAGFFSSRMGEDMKNMAEAVRKKDFSCEIGENETLGLVFPVYYWGLPTVVVHFLSRLKLSGKKPYVWAVITCGSSTGAADRQLKAVGKKAGIEVNAVFSLVMPDNFVPMFRAPEEKQVKEILAKADVRMEEILKEIRRRGSGEESKAKDLMLSASMQALYRNGRKTARFTVDDTCIGCGQCASFCPVGAIEMVGGRPSWKKERCAFCMGCLNRCPKSAIQYGKSTRKNGRYVYPRG